MVFAHARLTRILGHIGLKDRTQGAEAKPCLSLGSAESQAITGKRDAVSWGEGFLFSSAAAMGWMGTAVGAAMAVGVGREG